MSYRSIPNWPPVWVPRAGNDAGVIAGEVGMLKNVLYRMGVPTRCHLIVEHNGGEFIGTLLFDDAAFGWQVTQLLTKCTGRTIQEIGDLDLSFTT